ncbi:MAG TPA: LysM peptidoglycan-binding domain-containing protein [Candidatus Saccharimonadales bacterium]|nr:LysM peptidoglycan-binding domain-containing protein [Candidatus Saccharimonadales bacterium]
MVEVCPVLSEKIRQSRVDATVAMRSGGRMKIRNLIKLRLAQRSNNVSKQQTRAKTRHRTKTLLKPPAIAVYASTFVIIVAMVFIGYHEPQDTSVVANATTVTPSTSQIDQTSVDNVVATDVAANAAAAANLPIATSVANMAVSAQAKSQFLQTDDTQGTTKPQLVGSDSDANRTVISYTVKAGDTVESVAAQFKISSQTVQWANNLTADTLPVGSVLKILPVDGVLYAVKPGDTVDSIASKYAVDKTLLVLYNDLDVSGLQPNTSIILPNATLPGDERPGYVAPEVAADNDYNIYYGASGTGFGGTTWRISVGTPDDGPYAHGNCTLYAFNRRVQLGLPVGGAGGLPEWGNAGSWAPLAASEGLTVNHTPGVGSIMASSGHVAIVESLLPDGDISISEMNAYVPGGGYDIVSGRIVIAGDVGQYWYIH